MAVCLHLIEQLKHLLAALGNQLQTTEPYRTQPGPPLPSPGADVGWASPDPVLAWQSARAPCRPFPGARLRTDGSGSFSDGRNKGALRRAYLAERLGDTVEVLGEKRTLLLLHDRR